MVADLYSVKSLRSFPEKKYSQKILEKQFTFFQQSSKVVPLNPLAPPVSEFSLLHHDQNFGGARGLKMERKSFQVPGESEKSKN